MPKFKARVYTQWVFGLALGAVLAYPLLGLQVSSSLFVAAFLVPLVPSIYLDRAA